MNETTLLEFQLAEMLDAAKYVLCGLTLAVGLGLWVHATYFRADD